MDNGNSKTFRVTFAANPLLRSMGLGYSCYVTYRGRQIVAVTGPTRAAAWRTARAKIGARYLRRLYPWLSAA